MRRASLLALFILGGCYGPYDQGWDEGCTQGGLDGAMWGGIDAALCYSALPNPGPVIAGPGRYDEGFSDGYTSCFTDEYLNAWTDAITILEQDLGPCDELL